MIHDSAERQIANSQADVAVHRGHQMRRRGFQPADFVQHLEFQHGGGGGHRVIARDSLPRRRSESAHFTEIKEDQNMRIQVDHLSSDHSPDQSMPMTSSGSPTNVSLMSRFFSRASLLGGFSSTIRSTT